MSPTRIKFKLDSEEFLKYKNYSFTSLLGDHDGGRSIQESVRVPKTTVDTWKSLTLDEKYSDIHFQCQEEDGSTVSLPAHKAILARSSPYFDAMFSGAWLESSEGVIKVPYPANIIRALLTFLYTGVIEDALLQEHAVLLLSLAAEYMLPELQQVAERTYVKKLAIETVRDMLIVADNLDVASLKDACFNFIRRHSAAVLMDEDMMRLSTERPALWSEIRAALQAPADMKKMARGKGNGGGEGDEQGSKKRQRKDFHSNSTAERIRQRETFVEKMRARYPKRLG